MIWNCAIGGQPYTSNNKNAHDDSMTQTRHYANPPKFALRKHRFGSSRPKSNLQNDPSIGIAIHIDTLVWYNCCPRSRWKIRDWPKVNGKAPFDSCGDEVDSWARGNRSEHVCIMCSFSGRVCMFFGSGFTVLLPGNQFSLWIRRSGLFLI